MESSREVPPPFPQIEPWVVLEWRRVLRRPAMVLEFQAPIRSMGADSHNGDMRPRWWKRYACIRGTELEPSFTLSPFSRFRGAGVNRNSAPCGSHPACPERLESVDHIFRDRLSSVTQPSPDRREW